MAIVQLILDALTAGFPYTFCFLGIWLVFRLLNDFDLTVNGSFTLGAAVTAALITRDGWDPVSATVVSALVGGVAGLVTAFIHLRLRVILLLAGIITMTALYSVNLTIMILPTISFLNHPTIFDPFVTGGPVASDLESIALTTAILIVAVVALGLFLKTEFGLGMRATGANRQMAKTVGIDTDYAIVIFLVLGNVLVGLSGSIVAQQQFFSDASMGNEVILTAITSIMLGEIILWRTGRIWFAILGVILGTCLYQIAEAVAVRVGLQPDDLSAFTALLLMVTIGLSLIMGRGQSWLRIRRQAFRISTAPPEPVGRIASTSALRSIDSDGTDLSVHASYSEVISPFRTGGELIHKMPRTITRSGAPVFLDEIRVAYNRGRANENVALDGLTLNVPEGQFLTIIGSNGAGKSTLVSIIAGAVKPTSGSIEIHGRDVSGEAEHERARYIARVFQDPLAGTCPEFTIDENLALASKRGYRRGLRVAVTKKKRQEFIEYMNEFDLGFEHRLGQKVGGLSGGQRQALSVLMAVVRTPEVLLLDEHTAALDPKNQILLLEMTDRLVRENGCTTLMVTHNMDQAIRFGDRMVMLHRGRVLLDVEGDAKRRLTPQKLGELFQNAGETVITDEMLLI